MKKLTDKERLDWLATASRLQIEKVMNEQEGLYANSGFNYGWRGAHGRASGRDPRREGREDPQAPGPEGREALKPTKEQVAEALRIVKALAKVGPYQMNDNEFINFAWGLRKRAAKVCGKLWLLAEARKPCVCGSNAMCGPHRAQREIKRSRRLVRQLKGAKP